MYVIRITTALGRRFYWSTEHTGRVIVYQTKDFAQHVLDDMRHVPGDHREIIRIPFTENGDFQ